MGKGTSENSNFGTLSNTSTIVKAEIKLEDFKINDDQFKIAKVTHFIQHPKSLRNEYVEKI
jgi:hypothetical protein